MLKQIIKTLFPAAVSRMLFAALTTIALAAPTLTHGGDQEVLNRRIDLHVKKASLRFVLAEIEKAAEVQFVFQSALVDTNETITIRASNERLADVLQRVLGSRKIVYELDGTHIVLTRSDLKKLGWDTADPGNAPSKRLQSMTGFVSDFESGLPLSGVSVLLKGTTTGTTTDADGKFTLTTTSPADVLVFSFIGYKSQEVTVGERTEINIVLTADVETLNEVVVVGYGSQKKEDVISSISSVKGEDLVIKSMANFEAGLQGQVAGAFVQSQSGAPGAPVRILVRGPSSLNLPTDPLYIIDGMPISLSPYGLGSSNQSPMALINQNDIERVEVLKDAAATSIYGSRASNGVILVTTKTGQRKKTMSTTLSYSTGFSQLTRTPADVGYADTGQSL